MSFAIQWPTRVARPLGWASAACVVIGVIVSTPVPLAAPRDGAQLPALAFASVQTSMDAGRFEEALAALERDAGSGEPGEFERLLLRARVLERMALQEPASESASPPAGAARSSTTADDRVRAATAAWEAVASREPALQGLARRRTTELLVRADRREEAERVARAAAATTTAEARGLLLRVAAAYEAAQQFDRARPLYELVLQQQTDGADADRARVALARTLEGLGRLDEAVVLWRDAQRRMRGTDMFRVARQGERAASEKLGRPLAPFSESDYDALSRRLAAASRFEDALELLGEWQQVFPGSLDRDRIEVRRITALYNLRRNADARRAAAAFEHDDRPLALKAEMTIMRFRLAVRDGLVAEASEMGSAIWSGRIGGVSATDRRSVASLLANYWLSLGRVDEALDLYRELYTTAPDLGDKRSYLLRLCIAAERAGQHTRAVTNLRALLRLNPQSDARTGAEFWLGVALDGAGEREAGILALADVEVAYRHSYYGIRASERLNDLASRGMAAREAVGRARAARSSQLLFPDLLVSNAAAAAHDYQLGTSLLRAGLLDEGARQYRNVAARLTRDEALSLQAARASAAAADYRAAVGLVMNHFADTITRGAANEPEDLRTLAYPRPFWSEIRAAAGRAGVDPRLLVALMRRESRFDPRARSAVGALGLFQIMPYTATELAPGLGLAVSTDDEVLEPRVNAAIAAALVGRLTKLFGNALPPLVASYNAGEDRVSDWWRASATLPPELFVEMIPYAETRGFVREVLTNLEVYGRLYR